MAKGKILKIDLSVWQTQQNYAKENGLTSIQLLQNWIKRGKIERWHIEELNITLVKRKDATQVTYTTSDDFVLVEKNKTKK